MSSRIRSSESASPARTAEWQAIVAAGRSSSGAGGGVGVPGGAGVPADGGAGSGAGGAVDDARLPTALAGAGGVVTVASDDCTPGHGAADGAPIGAGAGPRRGALTDGTGATSS